MNNPRFHRILHPGILRGNEVWVSELLGILLVAVLLLVLLTISSLIYFNSTKIGRQGEKIALLRKGKVGLTHQLEQLRARRRLVVSLSSFVGHRLPDTTLHELIELVYHNSRRYGYDPLLVLSVIHVESVFDPRALGRYRDGKQSGALGLMQLKFTTAQEVARDLNMPLTCEEDLFKPEINIILGIAYLTRLISRFKSFKLGLLAYNQGPGIVARSLSERKPLSIRYYDKVLQGYFQFRAIADST